MKIVSPYKQLGMQDKLTVFLVEDDELYGMALDFKLRDALTSHDIVQMKTGEECLKNLHLNPDLIILDYYLPDQNGLEALKKIKQIKPEIPVVVLSKQQDLRVLLDLLHAGASDYIIKAPDAHIRLQHIIHRIQEEQKEKNETAVLSIQYNKSRFSALLWVLLLAGLVTMLLFTFTS